MTTVVCRNINLSCFEAEPMADTTTFATLKRQSAAATAPAGKIEFTRWDCCKTFSGDRTDCGGSSEFDKQSSSVSRLSAKSLELCTENLGSETGSDVAADCCGIFSAASSVSFDQENSCNGYGQGKLRCKTKSRNDKAAATSPCRRFPPPLTTMSGSNSLQVRRHREGGRLIIEAVETPFRSPYLQAERSGGRLRLCYLTDSDCDSDSGPESPAAPPPEAEVEEEEFEEPRNEFESGVEELEMFQRWSRCKERRHENEGMCNTWKPAFWVATS